MTADKQEREKLWLEYMNPDSEMSYHMLGKSCAGFNSKWVEYSLREPFFKLFYENIIEQLKTREKNTSNKLFHILKPRFKDYGENVLRNLDLKEKIDEVDMFWRKNLKEEFDTDIKTKNVLDFASEQYVEM